jgi:lipopolysaccharide biosynthesis glycosyltransferase
MKTGIVVKSDAGFYDGMAALLASIRFWHTEQEVRILDCGLTSLQRTKLEAACFTSISIPDLSRFTVAPEMRSYYTPAIYALLASPEILFDRTLHLDADCLVLQPITELLSYDILNSPGIAAATDYPPLGLDFQIGGKPHVVDEIRSILPNLKLNSTSFNGGVFLVRRDYFFESLADTVERLKPFHDRLWGNEMAILNLAAFAASPERPFRILDPTFNHRPVYSRAPDLPSVILQGWDGQAPVLSGYFGIVRILHFVGRKKPWREFDRKSISHQAWRFYREMAASRYDL